MDDQEENLEESFSQNPETDTDGLETSVSRTDGNESMNDEDKEERRRRRKEKKRKKREKRKLLEQQEENAEDQPSVLPPLSEDAVEKNQADEESRNLEENVEDQPTQLRPFTGDLVEKRKAEEAKIKQSWVQQMSIQNRVSPEPEIQNLQGQDLYALTPQTNAEPPEVILPERTMELQDMKSTGEDQKHGRVQSANYKDVIIGAGGEEGEGEIGCCGWILTGLSIIVVMLTIPFSIFFCLKVVQEYERAVIFRLGRLLSGGAKGPGIFFILPCIENYTKVDLRTVSFDVPPQEILTRDSVTVSVDAVVYYRVSNPTVSVANVENAHHATRLLAQTTLRNILGTKNMSEILGDREAISVAMQTMLDDATDRWGIKVERVEIKDVRLPIQLQRAMAAEAEASREARAKLLAAEGEHKASRALKEAADIINQSPAALQLRYLQTLNSISSEKNSTIIFPLPIDLVSTFIKK